MKREELIYQIRELVLRHFFGTLSTFGSTYPFGSLVRYSIDNHGQPVLLLSQIAEHTQNIVVNNKANLFILDRNNENVQECARLSLSGTVVPISITDDDHGSCLTTHNAYFPETKQYLEQLDFNLYKIKIDECHYVGGFAAAHKITGDEFRSRNPLDEGSLHRIISHMNEDHGNALIHYCEKSGYALDGYTPILVAVDNGGFQVRINKSIKRINFPHKINDAASARDAFVAMARS